MLVLLTAYTSIDGRQSTPVLFDERLVAATNAGGSMPIRHHGSLPVDTIVWPDIKPMWFSYRNPVSGRVPPLYCPDLKTCEKNLEVERHKSKQ